MKLGWAPSVGGQCSAELDGLNILRERARVLTPTPIGPGVVDVPAGAVLLLEAIPERTARTAWDWKSIGRTLAAAHRVRADQFGLEMFDGFFGPLPQNNAPASGDRWADLFIERRVVPRLGSGARGGGPD
jgi:fructosamine-3-kinase